MKRKGLGKGKGQGYKNLQGLDSKIHKDSRRGIKQPQKINEKDFVVSNRTNVRGQVTKLNPFTVKVFTTDGKVIHHRRSNRKFWDKDSDKDGKIDKTDCKPFNAKKQDLSQRQISNRKYEKYIIDSVDWEGDDELKTPPKTDKEKLKYLYDRFKSEYGHEIPRVGEQRAFANWLAGLPSVMPIPFYNNEILKFAKEMGSLPENATDKQEDRVLENYWNFMSNKTFQAFRKHKVI